MRLVFFCFIIRIWWLDSMVASLLCKGFKLKFETILSIVSRLFNVLHEFTEMIEFYVITCSIHWGWIALGAESLSISNKTCVGFQCEKKIKNENNIYPFLHPSVHADWACCNSTVLCRYFWIYFALRSRGESLKSKRIIAVL